LKKFFGISTENITYLVAFLIMLDHINVIHMKIQVVAAIGGGAPIVLDLDPHDTVAKIKSMVAKQRNIPAGSVIVVFRGQQLDDINSLKSVGMGEGDKCYLITRTEGGS
jgi:hypothetical protein